MASQTKQMKSYSMPSTQWYHFLDQYFVQYKDKSMSALSTPPMNLLYTATEWGLSISIISIYHGFVIVLTSINWFFTKFDMVSTYLLSNHAVTTIDS